jgi:hypothetical protein
MNLNIIVRLFHPGRTMDGAIRRFVPKRKRYTVFTRGFQQGFPQNLWMLWRVAKGI